MNLIKVTFFPKNSRGVMAAPIPCRPVCSFRVAISIKNIEIPWLFGTHFIDANMGSHDFNNVGFLTNSTECPEPYPITSRPPLPFPANLPQRWSGSQPGLTWGSSAMAPKRQPAGQRPVGRQPARPGSGGRTNAPMGKPAPSCQTATENTGEQADKTF